MGGCILRYKSPYEPCYDNTSMQPRLTVLRKARRKYALGNCSSRLEITGGFAENDYILESYDLIVRRLSKTGHVTTGQRKIQVKECTMPKSILIEAYSVNA